MFCNLLLSFWSSPYRGLHSQPLKDAALSWWCPYSTVHSMEKESSITIISVSSLLGCSRFLFYLHEVPLQHDSMAMADLVFFGRKWFERFTSLSQFLHPFSFSFIFCVLRINIFHYDTRDSFWRLCTTISSRNRKQRLELAGPNKPNCLRKDLFQQCSML